MEKGILREETYCALSEVGSVCAMSMPKMAVASNLIPKLGERAAMSSNPSTKGFRFELDAMSKSSPPFCMARASSSSTCCGPSELVPVFPFCIFEGPQNTRREEKTGRKEICSCWCLTSPLGINQPLPSDVIFSLPKLSEMPGCFEMEKLPASGFFLIFKLKFQYQ